MTLDTTLRSRRALLAGTVGGVLALAAQALARSDAARAEDGDFVRVGTENSASTRTVFENTDHGIALQGTANGPDGHAVFGAAGGGIGVLGTSQTGHGVRGSTGSPSGHGVVGEAYAAGATSIKGIKNVEGRAVWGEIDEPASGWAAVYGSTNGGGPGVYGENFKDGNGASGVAHGTGSGIYAQSDQGRGGWFVGKKAAIRLNPSAATNHPVSGAKGDLFVDKGGRLWFCKGGTTWKQLA